MPKINNNDKYLLCTDLDRTLIPNGPQSVSEKALPTFQALVSNEKVLLAYVSGRDIQRICDAIEEHGLPMPHYIIADVGSSIYTNNNGSWELLDSWRALMEGQWPMYSAQALSEGLPEFQHICMQQANQQGQFKLSFEVAPSSKVDIDLKTLENYLQTLARDYSKRDLSFAYKSIVSIDETKDEALIDVVPKLAGKLSAINSLIVHVRIPLSHAYFSGDSGNDEDVLLSNINACIVANATNEFKQALLEQAPKMINQDTLYFADGSLNAELNGNYSAGIVEGFIHYFPQAKSWIKQDYL